MVVVDFGRHSIKMAVAEAAAEAVRFDGITRVALPRGREGTKPGGQGVDDVAELAALVRAEVQRRGWQGMRAACLLSGSATSTQSFLFPPMPDADLRQAITLKLKETLHFDLESACVDFRRVPVAGDDPGGGEILTLGAAARKDAVMRAVHILERAGLEPVAVGAAAESLSNLSLAAGLCRDGETSIHANVGRDHTVLNLFDGRILRFTREIDVAGDAFTDALMRPILTALGPVQLTRQQAEEVKQAAGYPREGEDRQLPHGVTSEDILPLLEPVAQRLVAEISRSVDYLCGLLGRPTIDRVVLSGPAGRLENLDAMLAERLGIEVRYSDPVARAMAHWRLAIRDDTHIDAAGFSAILGYSIGNRRPINLLPRGEQAKQGALYVARICQKAAPLILGLSAAIVGLGVPIGRTYRSTIDTIEESGTGLSTELRMESMLSGSLAQLNHDIARVNAARGVLPDWPGILKELSLVLPDGICIEDFELVFEGARPTLHLRLHADPGDMPLEVLGARVISALVESPFFHDVHVGAASLDDEGRDGRLDVVLDVAAAPPPSVGGDA